MPRIRMTKLACSPAGTREIGSLHDVSAEEAKALIADNAAVLADPPPAVETATRARPENAAARTGKPVDEDEPSAKEKAAAAEHKKHK